MRGKGIPNAEVMTWAREVLAIMIEGAGLPKVTAQKAQRFLRRIPDWLLSDWACAIDVDLKKLSESVPDAAIRLRTEGGQKAIKGLVARHKVPKIVRVLSGVVKRSLKLFRLGKIGSWEMEVALRDLAALTMVGFFAEEGNCSRVIAYLGTDAAEPDELVAAYGGLMTRGDNKHMSQVDQTITDSHLGKSVITCLSSLIRFEMADMALPLFKLKDAERSPAWDRLWSSLWRN